MNTDLAKRLNELRKIKKISTSELAAGINVKEDVISDWESSRAVPDGTHLIKLSKFYNMPIDEILLNFDTDFYEDDEPEKDQQPAGKSDAQTVPPQQFQAEASEAQANTRYIKPKVMYETEKRFNWYAFPYPIIAVGLFLFIGSFYNVWHPTWLIFLTIPIYYTLIAMNNSNGSIYKKAYIFPYPIIIVIVYLLIGFDYYIWHPTWFLFLTIPMYYMLITWLKK